MSGGPPHQHGNDRVRTFDIAPLHLEAGSALVLSAAGPACSVSAGSDRCRVLGELFIGLDPEGVVVDAATDLAYAACSRSNHVGVATLRRLGSTWS